MTAIGAMPGLRPDLIVETAPARHGEPGFLVIDPFRHRFFRVSAPVLAAFAGRRNESPEDPAALARLAATGELAAATPGSWRSLADKAARARSGHWTSIAHAYLFFRIPLAAPQHALDRAWPLVAPLFGARSMAVIALIALVGVLAILRQWDVFIHQFAGMASASGLLLFGIGLGVIKSLHELGHAFMARKFAVAVPTIGIAFMVLMPVLYTETSAAWRRPARERVLIDAAGMLVEIAIAAIATLAWLILPDGIVRTMAFAAATIGWTMSLAVNLNPLMRFDGYYLLSDLTDMENLQERAFALARWHWRETAFSLGAEPPEILSPQRQWSLVAYAWAVWIYRLVLFVGIALLVYHMAFKILGIALFAVEIVAFIALPLLREARIVAGLLSGRRMNRRTLVTSAIAVALLLLALAPLDREVAVPAVLVPAGERSIHAPVAARLVSAVGAGTSVAAGDLLVRLESPDLDRRIERARRALALVEVRRSRVAADPAERSNRAVLDREAANARQELESLEELVRDLAIDAPFAGHVINRDPDLSPGRWLAPDERLMVLVRPGREILALADETSAARLSAGAQGRFVGGEAGGPVLEVRLAAIAPANLGELARPVFADRHGGPIAVDPGAGQSLTPLGSWYALRLDTGASSDLVRELPGTVHLDAEARSLAGAFLRRAAAILIRESGL